MNELPIGTRVLLKSDDGVFSITDKTSTEKGFMYEVKQGAKTFYTNPDNIILDNDVEVLLFKGYHWRHATDPSDMKHWHSRYVAQVRHKETGVIKTIAKLSFYFAKCTNDTDDFEKSELKLLLAEYQKELEESAESKTLVIKPFLGGDRIHIPAMRRGKDELDRFGLPFSWDEERNGGGVYDFLGLDFKFKADWVEDTPDTRGDEEREAEIEEEDRESDRRFNEWLAKSTEFSKEEFFSKVRSIMSEYDAEETKARHEDAIAFKGKTVEMSTWDYSEGIKEKAKKVTFRCKFVLEAKYEEKFCGIDVEITGHETYMGSSRPLKTREELNDVKDCMQLDYLEKKSGKKVCKEVKKPSKQKHFEQISLFDFFQVEAQA